MRYLHYLHPDDYAAMIWMRTATPPDSRILEAAGSQYTYAGRFGTMTGRPSFAGWLTHAWGWRGKSFGDPENPDSERQRRTDLTAEIYSEPDAAKAGADLDKIEISYVVVGAFEREQYPDLNEAKFEKIGHAVFHHGNTTVYKLDQK
jgi:uncharacterized membrane protein